jgi:hypothetical protein
MKTLRIPVAAAASLLAFGFAATSHADEAFEQSTTATTTTTTAPAAQTAAQPAPAAPQTVVVQPPASTTTTTAAPYATPGGDYAERETSIRPHRPLLSTGIGLFVVSYGASVVAGAVSNNDADRNLFVPVVGPWMDLAQRDGGGRNEDINKAMLVTSGIVQGAGVLMAVSSLFVAEKVETKRVAKTKPEVSVTPVSFGSGAGVGAVGTF